MTRLIWKWLTGLPDEYARHEQPGLHDGTADEIWDGKISQAAVVAKRAPKRHFDVQDLERQGVEIIDLTGEDVDVDGPKDVDEHSSRKARVQPKPVKKAGFSISPAEHKNGHRERKEKAKANGGGARVRTMKRKTVREGAAQLVC